MPLNTERADNARTPQRRALLPTLATIAAAVGLAACTIHIHQPAPPTGTASQAAASPAKTASSTAPTSSGAASTTTPSATAGNTLPTGTVTMGNPSAAMPSSGMPFGVSTPAELRKYEDVVTKDAKTARGMLLYHKVKERHLFEIPEALLGRDLLWSVEISQASRGGGFNGLPLGFRVLRFERIDNRILLRSVSFRNRGVGELKAATDAIDLAPIVMSFPVETEGSERSMDLRANEKEPAKKTDEPREERRAPSSTPAVVPAPPAPALLPGDIVIPMSATPVKVVLDEKGEIVSTIGDLPPPPPLPQVLEEALAAAEKPASAAQTALSAADSTTKTAPKKADSPPAPKQKWPVIEVSRLLLTTSSDLIDGRNMGPMGFGGVDPSRSLVGQVKVFPENVEARSTLTFASFSMPQMGMQGLPQMPNVTRNPTRTAVVHYSLALLPEKPMQGRYADERVGYFTEPFIEYGGERSGVREREFITRFRLEKKYPDQALSEPVKPITFYLSREVPERWHRYLLAGIHDWNVAFEKAGFKNAIIGKIAPTKEEDPRWDPEDARYSVIRWVAMPINNAMGPSVHDPRSGEVISAHVVFWHDLLAGLEQSYFLQAGAADARVKNLPLPDEVMGELLRSVATHEIGHTLGLRHNHRAATAYAVKDLRDPTFAGANGTSASIMSYARFNSVAQPGDGVTSFVPKLGPYDLFAIEWGYKPLGKLTAEQEVPELDKMAARQLKEPLLAFGGEDWPSWFDPEVQMENIGKERIAATRLSVSSLERAARRLVGATTKLGEDYAVLEATYFRLLMQRNEYVSSVVKLIGGVRETRFMGGRGGETFKRTTPEEQRAAIRFLLDEALVTPKWLLDPDVLNRLAVFNATAPLTQSQQDILADMLLPIRFRVLEDAEHLKPGSGMQASAYLSTIQGGLFRELKAPSPKIDIYRRNLQTAYVEQLKAFSGEIQRFRSFNSLIAAMLTDLSIDLRPAAIEGLKLLKRDLDSAEMRAGDTPSRLHIAQLSREIEKILKIRGN